MSLYLLNPNSECCSASLLRFGTGSCRMKWHSWSGSGLSRGIVARVGVIIVLKHGLPRGQFPSRCLAFSSVALTRARITMLRISVTFCNQLRVKFSVRWRCRDPDFLAGERITVSNAAGNPNVEHNLAGEH